MIDATLDREHSILVVRPTSSLEKTDFLELAALVTNSRLGDVAERLAAHFVSAEIRHFPAGELDAAKAWISVRS